jgi:hypothetical protein
MSDRSEEAKDRWWRKLAAIGTLTNAAIRLVELMLRH